MKGKLLTFMVGLTFIFLLSNVSFAKVNSINSLRAAKAKNISSVKILSGNALNAKYRTLMKTCNSQLDWDCTSATNHWMAVYDMSINVCVNSGWGSSTCSDYMLWEMATQQWADDICFGNY